jgi:hypothetical protein
MQTAASALVTIATACPRACHSVPACGTVLQWTVIGQLQLALAVAQLLLNGASVLAQLYACTQVPVCKPS